MCISGHFFAFSFSCFLLTFFLSLGLVWKKDIKCGRKARKPAWNKAPQGVRLFSQPCILLDPPKKSGHFCMYIQCFRGFFVRENGSPLAIMSNHGQEKTVGLP